MARRRISRSVSKRLKQARVARLATVGADGRPHVVPICFAADGEVFYTAIDRKPKRVQAERLTRVVNIEASGEVALVVDEYREDWASLWYVLVRGRARRVSGAQRTRAIRMLRRKYRQYAEGMLAEDALVIRIVARSVTVWGKV